MPKSPTRAARRHKMQRELRRSLAAIQREKEEEEQGGGFDFFDDDGGCRLTWKAFDAIWQEEEEAQKENRMLVMEEEEAQKENNRMMQVMKEEEERRQKEVAMAKRLQRAWRALRSTVCTHKIVGKFLESGATLERVQGMQIDDMAQNLRVEAVVNATRRCVDRLVFLSRALGGKEATQNDPPMNPRVILTALMVTTCPERIFEERGMLEQRLMDASLPLIQRMEGICNAIRASPGRCVSEIPRDLIQDFAEMVVDYLQRFREWKEPDKLKLTGRMKHALVALYRAHRALPPADGEATQTRIELRIQIQRLRNKMLQFAGREELQQFDAELYQNHHIQPMVVEIEGEGEEDNRAGGGAITWNTLFLQQRMTNEQLAHELLLDPDFVLADQYSIGTSVEEDAAYQGTRAALKRGFWDSLAADLVLVPTPCYIRVLRVLREIRDVLRDMHCKGNRHQAIDLDHIAAQLNEGQFGWDKWTDLMAAIVEIIQDTQAPRRNAATVEKWRAVELALREAATGDDDQPRVLCEALEFLLGCTSCMRIDAVNARLRLIAPVIKDHGVASERTKFQDKLNAGTVTLDRTSQWLRQAVERAVVNSDLLKTEDLLVMDKAACGAVHALAMVWLITQKEEPPSSASCAETLALDVVHLARLHAEFQYLVAAAASLACAKSCLLAPGHDNTQALQAIGAYFAGAPAPKTMAACLEDIRTALAPSSLSEEDKAQLLRLIAQCDSPTHSVRQLIDTRMQKVFVTRLQQQPGRMDDDATAYDYYNSLLVPAAQPLHARIREAAERLARIASVNREIYMQFYTTPIREGARKFV